MYNKSGGKVRLTFKLEQDQLWIGTKGNGLCSFVSMTDALSSHFLCQKGRCHPLGHPSYWEAGANMSLLAVSVGSTAASQG